jgi:hypothetical protein
MDPRSARFGLILAAITALALERFVPGGHLVLYPFTLLATWVHEMGHGIGALLVGGSFDHLEIYADASGIAYTSVVPGWRSALVSAAGLIGPPLAGASVLAFARGERRGATALAVIGGAVLVSVLFWVRSLVGVATMVPLGLVLVAAGVKGGRVRMMAAQLLGLLFALDTVMRLDYLFMSTASIGGVMRMSDVAGIAEGLFPPAILWGVLIALLDVFLLYAGLRAAWAPGPRSGATQRLGTADPMSARARSRQKDTV